ncbi:MAG TPA: hypothetical protein DET40_23975 [Lentisphaeria bacterium]|nr:MAG: hypothetical protein A2X45_09095 [Lentisphaerae bacterium GWF2_50_93]HCE46617.1 hypothetical protein [Lentisphaeria bacterium]
MDRKIEKSLASRAVELGKSGKAEAVPELLYLAKSSSYDVRRLAVSALGKLAGIANSADVVPFISHILRDPHPQVRQYAIKALSSYGAGSKAVLHDLRDISVNPSEKEYNRTDAIKAVSIISEAQRIREQQAAHKCQKCGLPIISDEYARSMKAFQRIYCDKCFDEVFLKRRNFDTEVELNKTITAKDGTLVQSDGERQIADFLNSSAIKFRYDERIRIIDGLAIRPDFYLPEFDVYIEYWGMDTADYKIGMLKKQKLYQQEGKKLVSLHFSEKARLAEILRGKLSKYMVAAKT